MVVGTGEAESTDLFPPSARVIFEKAPLIQVLAQVRFPPILKIEQTPADFQERVRGAFPLFEKTAGPALPGGSPPLPPQILQLLAGQIGGVTYSFQTENRHATLTLSADALTIATDAYTRWEDFLGQFRLPLLALSEIYAPAFYARVGLRYINGIQREKLGLPPDHPWSRLIRMEVLGETALPSFEKNLIAVTKQIRVKLEHPPGAIFFQHGLSTVNEQLTPSYMLDFDIYRDERTEVADAERVLNEYHSVAGYAIRWCIKQELLDALGPTPVERNGTERRRRSRG